MASTDRIGRHPGCRPPDANGWPFQPPGSCLGQETRHSPDPLPARSAQARVGREVPARRSAVSRSVPDPRRRGTCSGLGGNDLQERCAPLERKKPWPYVNHYHFHLIDPEWGHLTIKMSGHPPFGVQIMLNGHEWVERQARAQAISLEKEGNCFVGGSFQALDQLAETLCDEHAIGRLAEVCDRWVYSSCLCFALTIEEQQRSRFRYLPVPVLGLSDRVPPQSPVRPWHHPGCDLPGLD